MVGEANPSAPLGGADDRNDLIEDDFQHNPKSDAEGTELSVFETIRLSIRGCDQESSGYVEIDASNVNESVPRLFRLINY